MESGGLWESECLWAPDVFADKRSDLLPPVSPPRHILPHILPALVLAADTHLHLADYTAEELPHGDLDGLYADLVAELDDDPVFAGPAWREHVAVAGFVEEGGGVLGEGGGGVDAGGTVGGGVVVFARRGRGGGLLRGRGRGFVVCGGSGGRCRVGAGGGGVGRGEGGGRVVGGLCDLYALPFFKADKGGGSWGGRGGGGGGAFVLEQRPGVGGGGGGEGGCEGEEGEPAEHPHRTPWVQQHSCSTSHNNKHPPRPSPPLHSTSININD